MSFIYILAIFIFFRPSVASIGDTSRVQRICIRNCYSVMCSNSEVLTAFHLKQPWYERLLGWTCLQDCQYNCMWYTVKVFKKESNYVPQFHGKWPFIRILGLQEPASVVASVLNLIPHLFYLALHRQSHTTMHQVWTLYAIISVNTWVWSTCFHAKDTEFTEKMDYLSAFTVVTFSLMAFIIRLFDLTFKSMGLTCAIVAFFAHHVYYMAIIHFDYGYNMKVNIGVGAVNSICWLAWAFIVKPPHARYAAISILLLNASILLELLDFPPIGWILDSHALWHFSTAPIHFLWYRFVYQDSLYIMKTDQENSKLA